MNVSVIDLARANGFKRPQPKLSVTALVRDYFLTHPDVRISVDDLTMIIRSKDAAIDAKSVSRTLWRLSVDKGNYFLAAVGRGRGVQYKLAEKAKPGLALPVVVRGNNIAEMFQTIKAQAKTELESLIQAKDVEYNRYIQTVHPMIEKIKQLEDLLGV